MPTKAEEKAARQAIAATGSTAWLYVERGYQSNLGPGLLALLIGSAIVTLGASGIVTGLTNTDSRPDYSTLAAIGANPRTRLLLSMSSAGVTAFLGAVLGVVAGFIPAIGVLKAQGRLYAGHGSFVPMPIVIPWVQLALIALAIPLLAA